MKSKAKSTFYTLLGLFVAILVLVYMLVYKPQTEKTAELELSNVQLRQRVMELEQFYNMMPKYQKAMDAMTKEINDKLEDFPVDVRSEDAVFLALKTWVNEVIVDYTTIAITEREDLAVIDEKVVKGAAIEGFDKRLTLAKRQATYDNITTYQQLKEIVKTFDMTQEELAITNVAYGLNSSKKLEGTIDVTFFMLDGVDKEYVPKEFKEYPVGLYNLFKTVEVETIEELLAEDEE